MTDSTDKDLLSDINPHLKEQNEGIFNAFAREDHDVLTTPEIEEHVDLSDRQVRRRLDDLEDKGVIGSRKPGRTKLWWLKAEVEEPVSAKYPIIKLVQERWSLQLVALGVLSGIVAAVLSTAATLAFAYDPSLSPIGPDFLLKWGLIASMVTAGLFITAGVIAATDWLFKHLGIEIRYNVDD